MKQYVIAIEILKVKALRVLGGSTIRNQKILKIFVKMYEMKKSTQDSCKQNIPLSAILSDTLHGSICFEAFEEYRRR